MDNYFKEVFSFDRYVRLLKEVEGMRREVEVMRGRMERVEKENWELRKKIE